MSQPRSVTAPADAEDAILEEISALSSACIDGIDFLLEELESQEPDADERCGILDLRHEVYLLAIPKCRNHGLVVSIDRDAAEPHPCSVHGAVPASDGSCAEAARRTTRNLGLINPVWETT